MEQFIYWFIISEIIGGLILLKFRPKQDRCYWITLAIAGALALYNAYEKAHQASKQKKLAAQIAPTDATYKVSDAALANQGLAESIYNGRMPGATDEQNNIFASQGNTFGQINRNATNSTQALALAGGAQGQTNDSLNKLGIQEAQYKTQAANQLFRANQDITGENDKVYGDTVRKYNDDVRAKIALQQAAANNASGAVSDLTSVATAAGGLAKEFGTSSAPTAGTPQSATVGTTSGYPWMNYSTQNWADPSTQIPQVTPNSSLQPLATAGGTNQWNPGNGYFNYLTGRWTR